jgi:arginase
MGYLFDENLRVVTADVVARNPVGRAKQALEWLGERVDHILVHLDVDVIDPGQFPLGNVPSWTGFGFEEVMGALGVFLKDEKVVGLSLAEVNPDHDVWEEMVGRLVDEIVGALGGRKGINP